MTPRRPPRPVRPLPADARVCPECGRPLRHPVPTTAICPGHPERGCGRAYPVAQPGPTDPTPDATPRP